MFSKLFGHKQQAVGTTDPLHAELQRANAACEASQQGKLGMEEFIGVIALHCSLYIPHTEPLSGDPPNPKNWKQVMVEKNGVLWQYAFTNIETAREFEK